mgnify:CR=1 FL=1
MLKSYVAFDLETTGLSPENHEIIEIGALKVREGKVVDRFIEFVRPEKKIPPMITELTGISEDMVKEAGDCQDVLPDFLKFCEEDTLIGHNVQFDFSFVKTKAQELGYKYEHLGIDTLKIAKVVHADLPSRKLGDLCEYYHIKNAAAHRAYHDALATAKLYQSMAHFHEELLPKIFVPKPLQYKVKKKEPVTAKQIAFLSRLMEQKNITIEKDIHSMTKSEASRTIDLILSGNEKLH